MSDEAAVPARGAALCRARQCGLLELLLLLTFAGRAAEPSDPQPFSEAFYYKQQHPK